MQLIPNALAQFIDSSGAPLASGTVGFYFPGTLNPKATFQDMAGTIANPNPVPLNSRGQALIWGSGVYRQIVKDASGVTIWDQITEDPNAGLTGDLTDAVFVAGTDFTPGTTTVLTLPAGPGSIANTWIFFDAAYQDDAQATVNGTTLTFASPIPVGVGKVTVKIGTTVAVGTPGAGSVTDTSVATGANIDSAKLSFLQAGAGAVRRTVQSKLRDVVSVKDFGAKGDGTTDDTAAMQAAHNTGLLIYYPAGTYKFTTITMTNGGIVGDGQIQTNLTSTDTSTGAAITVNGGNLGSGLNPPLFRDFLLQGTSGKTEGQGLVITSQISQCDNASLENLIIQAFPTCVAFAAAATWSMCNCNIANYTANGVQIQNTNNPDSGDSEIIGCVFSTQKPGSTVAIDYISSGGLRVIGNKILGGAFGILLALNAPSSTSILIVTGNSIEAMTDTAISLNRVSGTSQFSKVVIGNNQFGGNLHGIVVDGSGFLSYLTIGPNHFDIINSGGGDAINLGAVDTFSIARQTIVGAGGAPNNGIVIGSGCTNGKVTPPTTKNIAQPLVRGSATCFVDRDTQVGTGNATVGTAYGSFFSGLATINFPTAFALVPEVDAQITSGTGGALGYIISAVTTTSFTISIIAQTNGASIPFAWQAKGVI